jgi:NAD(P)-dependent dehydrogenase (short-subunit alcohol dehydrogenase family)
MSSRLREKVALITGGCSGIGLGTVDLFLSEGARVVVADIDAQKGNELEREFGQQLRFARCDVREEADVQAAFALPTSTFGRLDIVVNNAGAGGTPESLEAMSVAGWDSTMTLLLRSAMLGIKHSVPFLRAAGGGAIINMASVAGLRPAIAPAAYSVAKAAILHLTRIAALELAPYGIRVNAICPGVIATPSIGRSFGASQEDAQRMVPRVAEVAASLQPIARAGAARDIAEACLFLGSQSAAFLSGSELVVDGALTQLPPQGYAETVQKIVQLCTQ